MMLGGIILGAWSVAFHQRRARPHRCPARPKNAEPSSQSSGNVRTSPEGMVCRSQSLTDSRRRPLIPRHLRPKAARFTSIDLPCRCLVNAPLLHPSRSSRLGGPSCRCISPEEPKKKGRRTAFLVFHVQLCSRTLL